MRERFVHLLTLILFLVMTGGLVRVSDGSHGPDHPDCVRGHHLDPKTAVQLEEPRPLHW